MPGPFEEQLDLYLRARCTLVVVVTPEEERALRGVRAACEGTRRACVAWDVAEGFQPPGGPLALPAARDPLSALEQIDRADGDAVFVLKDFHDCWGNGPVRRRLRNLAQRLKYSRKSILVLTPTARVPDELKDEAVVIDFPPPTAAELEGVLDTLTGVPGVRVELSAAGRERLIQAARGLTAAQAQRVFAKAIVADGVLDDQDVDLVTQEKKQVIRESESLEFYPATQTVDDVGGLGVLKEWLRLRERAFTREAREYGLPTPRGICLLGIPGTGKSLTAKMVAALWRVPLLRLDVGSLFGSLIGESEERTRRALRVAEATAPSVLWIDEVEKALAHGGLDAGTSARVVGTILTWMQEKEAPVFCIATANAIGSLPPELVRKGRFDEVFFLDLPTQAEREEILTVHLRKRRRRPGGYGVERLARLAEGYVGAELEQAVVDAMYAGFNAGREFTGDDVAEALRRLVPLSVSQRETVEALRAWLRQGRAQSASFREATEAERAFVPLRLHGGDGNGVQ